MSLFLFRFWPVLIPFLFYAVWYIRASFDAKKTGKALPRFRDGPWYWAVLSSLTIGMICFMWLAVMETGGSRGEYTPPEMEDGKIVPGRVSHE